MMVWFEKVTSMHEEMNKLISDNPDQTPKVAKDT